MTTNSISSAASNYFQKRATFSLAQKILMACLMAALTGIAAQIRIPLPFTPVPVTGQTFAVLLSAILLGKNWGGISQFIYVGLGAAGLPWFSGFLSGPAILLGPTGGYLIGFILAGFFLGHMLESFKLRSYWQLVLAMLVTNQIFIFGIGLAQLSVYLHLIKGQSPAFTELLALGYFPFVIGDLIKVSLAAGVAKMLLPSK